MCRSDGTSAAGGLGVAGQSWRIRFGVINHDIYQSRSKWCTYIKTQVSLRCAQNCIRGKSKINISRCDSNWNQDPQANQLDERFSLKPKPRILPAYTRQSLSMPLYQHMYLQTEGAPFMLQRSLRFEFKWSVHHIAHRYAIHHVRVHGVPSQTHVLGSGFTWDGMVWQGFCQRRASVFCQIYTYIYISPVSKADRNQMSDEHILYMDAYIYRIMCTIHIIYKRNVETTAYVFDTGQT